MIVNRTVVIVVSLLAGLMMTGPSAAAEIERIDTGEMALISLNGAIEEGDYLKFDAAASGADAQAIVLLNSPGGLTYEGLKIAAQISIRGFSTAVFSGKQCASMCAIIWVSGKNKYMNPDSIVEFHASYFLNESGEATISGSANAEIGAFLNTIGVSREAIRLMTEAGPHELTKVNHAVARAIGIDVVVIENGRAISPQDMPTPHALAERVGALEMLAHLCEGLVPNDAPDFLMMAGSVRNQARTMVVEREFESLVERALYENFHDIPVKDGARICIRAERIARSSGYVTGFTGPSFSCNKIDEPSRSTICKNSDLWASDCMMNKIYNFIKGQPPSEVRTRFLVGQRAWLGLRESCGRNANCIGRLYDSRFQDIFELVNN